jgi:hypothetical protein
MGHGLAEVDAPYRAEIMNRVDLATTRWTISVFNDLAERTTLFEPYGIAPYLVTYKPLGAF